jgi:quinol monooxygenase YgiN
MVRPVIIITGSILASEDSLEELRRLSVEHVVRSRQEPGCLSHGVHQDVENPLRLVFFERWANMDAVRAHFAVPESGAFVKRAGELAESTSDLELYQASPIG